MNKCELFSLDKLKNIYFLFQVKIRRINAEIVDLENREEHQSVDIRTLVRIEYQIMSNKDTK